MRRRHGDGPRRGRRQARHAPEERRQQQVRVRQARGRVARHAEDRRRTDVAERGRLARLDRDAVERHVAFPAQHVAGQVAFADRAAAREHQDVRSPGDDGVDGGVERGTGVPGDRMGGGDAPVLGDDRGEGVAVDVVDPARREGPAGLDQLVAGRHDADARPVVHFHRGQSERGGRADAARRQDVAGAERRLAGRDVGAPPSDVLARPHRRADVDLVAAPAGLLDHHHCVRAAGQRGAGRDLEAFPGADRAGRHFPGVDRPDAPQPDRLAPARPGRVGRHHGVAVHRGAVERRHVTGRDDPVGEHPAVRLGQPDPHGALERPGGVLDDAQRLIDRDRLPKGTHLRAVPVPVHRRASRTARRIHPAGGISGACVPHPSPFTGAPRGPCGRVPAGRASSWPAAPRSRSRAG